MEWNKQLQPQPQPQPQLEGLSSGGNNGGMFGYNYNVMTEEQMEILGKQIAAYATICQQLEELHRSLTFHDDLVNSGSRLGYYPYWNPLLTSSSSGHKLTRRQRWNPTAMQIQILEGVFNGGNQNPSKEKVAEITAELAKHGLIAEQNVYNWFQNRRARMKKKQVIAEASDKVESDVEIVGDLTDVNYTNPETMEFDQEQVLISTYKDFCNQNPKVAFG